MFRKPLEKKASSKKAIKYKRRKRDPWTAGRRSQICSRGEIKENSSYETSNHVFSFPCSCGLGLEINKKRSASQFSNFRWVLKVKTVFVFKEQRFWVSHLHITHSKFLIFPTWKVWLKSYGLLRKMRDLAF